MLDEAMDELVEMKDRWESIPAYHALMGEVLVQKGRWEDGLQQFKRACSLSDAEKPTFLCRSCGETSQEWMARCPSCDHWNSYFLDWAKKAEG